jgi:diguanylate cyclase (GGDEF)-like protein
VDIPCRYGGDELAALLTDTDARTAQRVAERIRALVTAQFADSPFPVTTSIGVAQLRASSSLDDELFLSADRALYEAKRAGGNRVVLARSDRADAVGVSDEPSPAE